MDTQITTLDEMIHSSQTLLPRRVVQALAELADALRDIDTPRRGVLPLPDPVWCAGVLNVPAIRPGGVSIACGLTPAGQPWVGYRRADGRVCQWLSAADSAAAFRLWQESRRER